MPGEINKDQAVSLVKVSIARVSMARVLVVNSSKATPVKVQVQLLPKLKLVIMKVNKIRYPEIKLVFSSSSTPTSVTKTCGMHCVVQE